MRAQRPGSPAAHTRSALNRRKAVAKTAADKASDRASEARVIANMVKRAEGLSPKGFDYLLDLLQDVSKDRGAQLKVKSA